MSMFLPGRLATASSAVSLSAVVQTAFPGHLSWNGSVAATSMPASRSSYAQYPAPHPTSTRGPWFRTSSTVARFSTAKAVGHDVPLPGPGVGVAVLRLFHEPPLGPGGSCPGDSQLPRPAGPARASPSRVPPPVLPQQPRGQGFFHPRHSRCSSGAGAISGGVPAYGGGFPCVPSGNPPFLAPCSTALTRVRKVS